MICKIIFANLKEEEKADRLAEMLLKKKLALYVDVIKTKSYRMTDIGKVEKEKEYLLIAKTNSNLVKEAKKEILCHIPYEKGDMILLDASDKATRMDLLLSKLTGE